MGYLFIIILLELIILLVLLRKLFGLIEESKKLNKEMTCLEEKIKFRDNLIKDFQKDIDAYKKELKAKEDTIKELQKNLTIKPVKLDLKLAGKNIVAKNNQKSIQRKKQ